MAFSIGEGIASFAQGASKYAVNAIEDQRKADMELKKAQVLADLQAATEERLAQFREKILRDRTDKDLSGAEGDEMVYRDAEGREKSRRGLTADEKEARQRSRDKDDLERKKGEASIRASDAQIRQGDERNALTRRGQDLNYAANMARNSSMGKGAGGLDSYGDTGSAMGIGYQLTGMNKSIVDNAVKAGVPAERVQQLANIVVSRALAKGERNLDVINSDFLDGLTELRKGVEGTGDNAAWSLSTYNANTASRRK